MFDFVQNNKFAIKIILGAVALTFVGFGVGSYSAITDDPYLAKVGDSKIYKRDLDKLLEGRPADAAMRQAALENLIRQELILSAARRGHASISAEELRRVIASIPAFQENGAFSPARYKEFLQSRYLSADAFEANVMRDVMLQNQLTPFVGSQFVSQQLSTRMVALLGETRMVRSVLLKPESFAGEIKLDDAALKTYYDANLKRFTLPEAVKLDYVVLSQEALASKLEVGDDEARKAFDSRKGEFAHDERRVSHILLTVPKDAKPEARAKVKAEAEALLKEVRANPARFAELARSKSQDPGSAANGGDLGFFGRGAMVKPFEDVAFRMKQGQISEVVETEFGYHILKLDEVRETDFDAARTQVLEKLRKEKAAAQFRTLSTKLADISYQQGGSLQPVAKALQLDVRRSDWLSRNKPATDAILANPKVVEAAFSDDVLKGKNNSEPVDVGNNTMVVVRVAEHQPARQQKLDEVRDLIRAELVQREGAKLADKRGQALLAELKAGKGVEAQAWGAEQALSRRAPSGLPVDDVRAVFAAPVKTLPAFVGVRHDSGDYALYRVDKVVPVAKVDPAEAKQLGEMIARMSGDAQVGAYLEMLRQKTPVVIKQQPAE